MGQKHCGWPVCVNVWGRSSVCVTVTAGGDCGALRGWHPALCVILQASHICWGHGGAGGAMDVWRREGPQAHGRHHPGIGEESYGRAVDGLWESLYCLSYLRPVPLPAPLCWTGVARFTGTVPCFSHRHRLHYSQVCPGIMYRARPIQGGALGMRCGQSCLVLLQSRLPWFTQHHIETKLHQDKMKGRTH